MAFFFTISHNCVMMHCSVTIPCLTVALDNIVKLEPTKKMQYSM